MANPPLRTTALKNASATPPPCCASRSKRVAHTKSAFIWRRNTTRWVGDPLYGLATPPGKGLPPEVRQTLLAFPRQALHATALTLSHPADDDEITFASPLPADMQTLLAALRPLQSAT